MFKRTILLAILCAALCSMLTPALGAASTADSYAIEVDVANQITTVFRRSDGAIVRQMICSTGVGNCTPLGEFRLEATRESTDRQPWYYIVNYRCYVKYATRITGSILFHSIPYADRDLTSIDENALGQLGSKASHGCIRLNWEDAYWIACNCPDGTRVSIYNGATRKSALRDLLLTESYTITRGQSYKQFIDEGLQSHSAEALRHGETGDAVARLQARLIALGYLCGGVTGIYDGATVVAVMRYQADSGLPGNGVATRSVMDGLGVETDS